MIRYHPMVDTIISDMFSGRKLGVVRYDRGYGLWWAIPTWKAGKSVHLTAEDASDYLIRDAQPVRIGGRA